MFKPNTFIKSLKHQEVTLNKEFSILCWNVAKLTLNKEYKIFFDNLMQTYSLDIFLLQEAKKHLSLDLDIYDYSYILSPNIETKKHIFGVLSAFRTSCIDEFFLLTKKRELAYMTHKVSLITHHKLSTGANLVIVNLHAINFVKNSDFKDELSCIYESIKSYTGSMIVAGDFNTWNVQRVTYLKEFVKELSLSMVEFKDESNLKKVFSNSIDYIFYRGLHLLNSEVIDSKKISDHNPIIAKFSIL